MARRGNSSSDEDEGEYSRRHVDRKLHNSSGRYSPPGSKSPKRMNSSDSDSDSNRARRRGHGHGHGSGRLRRRGSDSSSEDDLGRRRERKDFVDKRREKERRVREEYSSGEDVRRDRKREDGRKGGNGSSSEEEVGRLRGRRDGGGDVNGRKRGMEVIKERNEISSDEEMGRRRGREVGERGDVDDRKRDLGKGIGLDKSRQGGYDSSDDEMKRMTDREVRERGDVDDKQPDMEDGELSDRAEDVGRGKKRERGQKGREKEREYDSDDSRKIGDRRKEKGGEDKERASGRGKELDGRTKRGAGGEGDRSFRERDDEKRGERHGTGMGKDDNGHHRNGKGEGKDSGRVLENEDEKDDVKDQRDINGRDGDEKRHRRTYDGNRNRGREDKDDGRKERRRDDRNRHGGREDKDDGRKERRRDDENRHGGREDKDDGRKERRNDRDRETRRDYNDEKDRRRNDGDDRRNVRTEVEKDNKSGREREEGGGNVREDPRAQRPDVNLNMDMANLGRSGGVYIPPFKLARMLKEVEDKSSTEYQRMTWDALRKSINGLVNKVNSTNAKNIIPELFAENLIRGRGLFCRSCMKSQMASPGFTDVFSALVAVVNTKFPEVGDLLLRRIILQLQRAFKRNDKPQLLAAVKFIAHLVNQQVVHELIALELLTLLLRDPTDDSVEVAVGFVTECGAMLQDLSPRGLHAIFERFRGILHEGEIDKRVQFLIEGLFALRKAKFQNYPAVRPELDLVELEDQITHEISLSAEIDPEISLDIFKPDPQFLENEKRYEDVKKQILGEESEDDDDDDDESGAESDEDSEEDSEEEDEEQMRIRDETETNLVNLRRTIYLTIMSSVDFEEAGHKLLKIKLEPGQEMELCIMLLECCSQERTYLRYYGLLGQRFCMINKVHQENFEKCFVQQYSMIHRLETNKLRNVAKFFAHLLGTDALPWHVLAYIRLTEEDTTSSSRIFIKILFQELSEHLGIRLLNDRLTDPTLQESFDSIFPKDNPKNTRFAINFFTSIGLGGITENLREYLKNMPRLIMQQQKPQSESEDESSGSDSSDSGSSSSSSSSESDSESERDNRRKRRRR